MFGKLSLAASAAVIALLVSQVPASAVDARLNTALEAETRIALAAKEATVVEDIVKAACMLHLGVDAERHAAMIQEDAKEFETVLTALQFGADKYGLARENHSKVIDALRTVKADWLPFRDRADVALEAGTPSADLVLWLGEHDLALLENIEALENALQKTHGGKARALHVVVATKLAQRQATIAQRIAKESCFISAGLKVDEMRAKQAEMVTLFESTMTALRDGMPMLGIQKPTSAAVIEQWAAVDTHWQSLRESIAPIDAGGELDGAALAEMSRRTSALIEALDSVVMLYAGET